MFIFHQALNYLFSNENTSIDSAAYVSIRICICIFMSFLWGAKQLVQLLNDGQMSE